MEDVSNGFTELKNVLLYPGISSRVLHFLEPDTRKTCRLVCHALKSVVDENVREMRFGGYSQGELISALPTGRSLLALAARFPRVTSLVMTSIIAKLSYSESFYQALDIVWPELETIMLCRHAVEKAALRLSQGKHWIKIKKIMIVYWHDIRQDGTDKIKNLARIRWPPSLEELEIRPLALSNEIPGFNILVGSLTTGSHFGTLRKLDLSRNGLKSECINILLSVSWPVLKDLDLGINHLGSKGIARLIAGAGNLPALEELDVGGNSLGWKTMIILASGQWNTLKTINLSRNYANSRTDEGGSAEELLAALSLLPNLLHVHLWGNEISLMSDAGLRAKYQHRFTTLYLTES